MNDATRLQDALGLIDERYLVELDAKLRIRASRRRQRLAYLTAAACLCVALGLGLSRLFGGASPAETDFALPDDMDNMIWAEPATNEQVNSENAMVMMKFLNWSMDGDLYLALQEAGREQYLAVAVRPAYDYNDMMSFSYLGKTRGQWEVEHEILQTKLEKLSQLPKDGPALCYGDAVYTTDIMQGARWSKELYQERIAYYGEYFLSQYIVDGTYLTDKVAADLKLITEQEQQMQLLLTDLVDAYRAQKAGEMYPIFEKEGLLCTICNGSLFVFVTKDQLTSAMQDQNKEDYYLELAPRRVFEQQTDLSDTMNKTVSGFACEKLRFYTADGRYGGVSSDTEALDAMAALLERFQYERDCICISVYSNGTLTDSELAMPKVKTSFRVRTTHADITVLRIFMEDFDPIALRDLSLLPQVTSITLGPDAPFIVD